MVTVVFFLAFVLVLTAGLVLVVYGTAKKTRWGVTLDRRACPRCATPLPRVRRPQNLRQVLWGGSTCPACGLETDKWGRTIPQI